MPHQIDWENNGIFLKFTGLFTHDAHTKLMSELFNSSGLDYANYIIADYSEAELQDKSEIDAEDSLALSSEALSYLPGMKIAVVTSDPKLMELCNQYMSLSKSNNPTWKTKLFKDIKTAREWAES